ncbi:MAG: tRNA(Ile)-lysidine synthase [Actinomycetota bacterium]|jgi:tRNA(Ile)-lysidine synthase|nr:tRNA(Ile)-lysidine synthase [Actinomycetota bacterium]
MTAAAGRSKPPALARVLERVTATVRAHHLVTPGQTVLLCVSGGPDSVCLVETLVRLRRLFKMRLEIFHLDHRLRDGSSADADYVERLAARHGLPYHLRVATERPARGVSVEAWARDQRMAASEEVADRIGAERIAEGHTMDDQAETVLIALVRGGGLEALAGIAPMVGRDIQPLLDVTRAEVEGACRSLRLRPRTDPTNADTRLLRNAIRLIGLPALEAATGRELGATIARTAGHLRGDARELAEQAERATDRITKDTAGGLTLHVDALLDLPEAIGARVVRISLYRLGILPTHTDIEAVLDLAVGRPGRHRDLTASATARRTASTVELFAPQR